MGFWSLIRPEKTINLIENPSFETGIANWTKNTGLLLWERSAEKQVFGGFSGHMQETNSGGSNDDFIQSSLMPAVAGQAYTLSLYYQREGGNYGAVVQITWLDASLNLIDVDFVTTAPGDTLDWTRLALTATAPANTTSCVVVISGNSPNGAAYDLWFDGVQLEAHDHFTTYCDGDQPGCFWEGARHGSGSYRPATSRAGGREYNLTELEFFITQHSGSGTPPIRHTTQPRPLQPGASYVGQQVLPRVFDLTGVAIGTTYTDLHAVRKELIDSIKADAVPGNDPMLLRYSGAGKTLECRVYYDTGLDLTTRDGFTEEIDLRLIAYDPFFYELGSAAMHLTPYEALVNFDPVVKRDGVWQTLGDAAVTGGNIRCAAVGPDRNLYVGGNFSTIGGVSADNIAMWDGEEWNAVGTGLSDTVHKILFGPDGTLYAIGEFEIASSPGVGSYSEGTWGLRGGAFNGSVNDIAIDSLGNLYAVGNFTEINGNDVKAVAKWDGSTWSELPGQWEGGGGDPEVFGIAVGINDDIYIGGQFSVFNPVENAYAVNFSRWDGAHWEVLQRPNGPVRKLAVHRDGSVYLVGDFTQAPVGRACRGVAMYRGGGFIDMQGGANDSCERVSLIDDLVYISGPFTSMGGDPSIQYSAIWTGSSWAPTEFGTLATHTFAVKDIDRLYLGGMSHSGNKFPKANVVVNSGTRTVYPKLTIRRGATATSAHLTYLKNETSGAAVYFNYHLQLGEELVVNFDPDNRYIRSSYYGDVWRAVLRSSDFAGFFLLPGENVISFRVSSNLTSAVSAWLEWRNCHWSIDGGVEE